VLQVDRSKRIRQVRNAYLVFEIRFAVDSYTLADLVRVTGAKRRSLQLWADAGVIRAKKGTNRAGTGTHRLFSRDEAIVACIVHAFAQLQMSIGQLLNVASVCRTSEDSGSIRKNFINPAISGERDSVMIFHSWRERGGTLFGVTYTQDDQMALSRAIGEIITSKPDSLFVLIKLRDILSKIDS
jgi:hypothetical protein